MIVAVFLFTTIAATPAAAIGRALNAVHPPRKADQGYEFVDLISRFKIDEPGERDPEALAEDPDTAAMSRIVEEETSSGISEEEYRRQLEEIARRMEQERQRREWMRTHSYAKSSAYYKEKPRQEPSPATDGPDAPEGEVEEPGPPPYQARDDLITVTFAEEVTFDEAIIVVSGFGASILAATGEHSFLVGLPESLPAPQAIVAFLALPEVAGAQPVYEPAPQPEETPTPAPAPEPEPEPEETPAPDTGPDPENHEYVTPDPSVPAEVVDPAAPASEGDDRESQRAEKEDGFAIDYPSAVDLRTGEPAGEPEQQRPAPPPGPQPAPDPQGPVAPTPDISPDPAQIDAPTPTVAPREDEVGPPPGPDPASDTPAVDPGAPPPPPQNVSPDPVFPDGTPVPASQRHEGPNQGWPEARGPPALSPDPSCQAASREMRGYLSDYFDPVGPDPQEVALLYSYILPDPLMGIAREAARCPDPAFMSPAATFKDKRELIVAFREDVDPALAGAINSALGASIISVHRDTNTYCIRAPPGASSGEMANIYMRLPEVRYAVAGGESPVYVADISSLKRSPPEVEWARVYVKFASGLTAGEIAAINSRFGAAIESEIVTGLYRVRLPVSYTDIMAGYAYVRMYESLPGVSYAVFNSYYRPPPPSDCPDGVDPQGFVTDAISGIPLEGAEIKAMRCWGPDYWETAGSALSGSDGFYDFLVPAGDYTLFCSLAGYVTAQREVTVIEGEVLTADFALEPLATLSGRVTDAGTGLAIENAQVKVATGQGVVLQYASSDADGNYALELEAGEYQVTCRAAGYAHGAASVSLSPGQNTADFSLAADGTPPAVPGDVQVAQDESGAVLTWSAPPDADLYGYHLYRALEPGGPYELAGQTTHTTFTDMKIRAQATYYYIVRAVDGAQNESAPSAQVSLAASDMAAPIVVEEIMNDLGRVIPGEAKLFMVMLDETGVDGATFQYYDTAASSWVDIGTDDDPDFIQYPFKQGGRTYPGLWWAEVSWDASPFSQGERLELRTVACDGTNTGVIELGTFTIDHLVAPLPRPPAPSIFAEPGRILVSWDDWADDCLYRVYRASASGGPYELISSILLGGEAFADADVQPADTDILPGVTYYYVMTRLALSFQESPFSEEVLATALPRDGTASVAAIQSMSGGSFGESGTVMVYSLGPVAEVRLESSVEGSGWQLVAVNRQPMYDPSSQFFMSFFAVDSSASSGSTVWLRATALDSSGSGGEMVASFIVDRGPPASPIDVVALSAEGGAHIHWRMPEGAAYQYFRIYRTETPGRYYRLVADRLQAQEPSDMTHTDGGLLTGITYYYVVTAVDYLGNESILSLPSTVTPDPDITDPQVLGMDPTGYVGRMQLFTVMTADNSGVCRVSLSYFDGLDWQLIFTDHSPVSDPWGSAYISTGVWDTSALPEGEYQVRASAEDLWGNTATTETSYQVDHTAPAEILNLAITPGPGYIDISFDPSAAPDLSHYMIYRATEPEGPFQPLTRLSPWDGESYRDSLVGPDTTYYYRVIAVDGVGNESSALGGSAGALEDVTPPSAGSISFEQGKGMPPGIIGITVQVGDDVRVTLVAFEYSEDGGGTWNLIGYATVIRGNSVQYAWTGGHVVDAEVLVRATAIDAWGNEGSAEGACVIDKVPPEPPANLAAESNIDSVTLTWDPSLSVDVVAYRVYRSTTSGGPYIELLASPGPPPPKPLTPPGPLPPEPPIPPGEPLSTTYTDMDVEPDTMYYYVVAAVDGAYNVSAYSNEASGAACDDEPPVVAYLLPEAGAVLHGVVILSAAATDHVGVDYLDFHYHDGEGWILIASVVPIFRDGTGWVGQTVWNTTALSGETVQVRVVARDPSGNTSEISRIYAVDNTPPPVPGNLVATGIETAVILTWDAVSAPDLHHYDLYRSAVSGGPYALLAGGLAGTTYLDEAVDIGVAYFYVVASVDNVGNQSAYSAKATDSTPPAIPQGLSANGGEANVLLSWDQISGAYYNIYRSEVSGGPYGVVAAYTTGASYMDTAVAVGVTYYYVLASVDVMGNESPYSPEASAVVLENLTPPRPENVYAVGWHHAVRLSWEAVVVDDLAYYNIYRSDSPGGPYAILAGGIDTEFYLDEGLAVGVTYYYVVSAVDLGGLESAYSYKAQASAVEGETPPQIGSLGPADNSNLSGAVVLSAWAVDEAGVHCFTFSYSADGNAWVEISTIPASYEPASGRFTGSALWDTTAAPNGAYLVYVTAVGLSGLTDTLYRTYMVDNVAAGPPDAPGELMAMGQAMKILIGCSPSSSANAVGYHVYRRVGGGDWELVAEEMIFYGYYMFYMDAGVPAAGTYEYMVRAIDALGTEGPGSNVASATALADDDDPLLGETVSPQELSKVLGVAYVTATATDSGLVREFTFEYYDSASASWTMIGTFPLYNPYKGTVYESLYSPLYSLMCDWQGQWQSRASWDISALEPGSYELRVTASDLAGHTGSRIFAVDITGPDPGDTTPPVINWVYPYEGATVGFIGQIYARATDDVRVEVFRFYWSPDGVAWTEVGTVVAIPYASPDRVEWYGNLYPWDTSAIPEGTAWIRVVAVDAGWNEAATKVKVTVDHTRPDTPANFRATPVEGSINLSWDACSSPDFSYYRLYRAKSPGGPYSSIEYYLTKTTYTDLNATIGQASFYRLVSVDRANNESDFAYAFTIPLHDSTPPVIVSLEPPAGTVILGRIFLYAKATDNARVKSFLFEYYDAGQGAWLTIGTSGAWYYSWEGTWEGSVWWWDMSTVPSGECMVRVTAIDSGGNTAELVQTYLIQLDTEPPPAPGNLTATPGILKVILSWDPSSAPDLAYYRVYRRVGAGGAWEVINWGTSDNSYADRSASDLSTTYFYYVTALDGVGNESDPSAEVSGSPLPDEVPPEIQSLYPYRGQEFKSPVTVFSVASDDSTVSWFAFYYSLDGVAWTLIGTDDSPVYQYNNRYEGSLDWTPPPLDDGTVVYLKVAATDAYGNSSWYSHACLANINPPDVPSGVTVEALEAALLVSWSPYAEPPSDFSYFIVYRRVGETGAWEVVTYTASHSYRDRRLDPVIVCYYYVTGVDRVGNQSAPSDVVGASPLPDTTAPVITYFYPGDSVEFSSPVTLYAEATDSTGVDRFAFYYSLDGSAWTMIGSYEDPYGYEYDTCYTYYCYHSWTLPGIPDGPVFLKLEATDFLGQTSEIVRHCLANQYPPPPPVLTASPGELCVVLDIEPPPVDDVSYYKILRGLSPQGPFSYIGLTVNITYSDRRLDPAVTYYYRVAAVDRMGHTSEPSNVAGATPLPDVTPPVITYFSPGEGEEFGAFVTLSVRGYNNWGIDSFAFHYSIDGVIWIEIGVDDNPRYTGGYYYYRGGISWTPTGIADGPIYLKVTATDLAGLTCEEVHYCLANPNPPSAPVLTAVAGERLITLSWEAPPEEDVTRYRLYRKVDPGADFVFIGELSGLTYTDRRLDPAVTYYYRVTAVDRVGNQSIPSIEVSLSPLEDATPPEITYLSPGESQEFGPSLAVYVQATDNCEIVKFSFYYSLDGQARVLLGEVSPQYTGGYYRYTGNYSWTPTDVPDGPITIIVVAEDVGGNRAEQSHSCLANPNSPSAPVLTAVAGERLITLSWEAPPEDDVSYYRLYRMVDPGTGFVLLSTLYALEYTDRCLDPAVTYYYRVTAVDRVGNESGPSAEVSLSPLEDTTPPEITYLSPGDGQEFRSPLALYVEGADNCEIVKFSFYYEIDAGGRVLVSSDSAPRFDGGKYTTSYEWTLAEDIPDGPITIIVVAEDIGGNRHEHSHSCVANLAPPPVPANLRAATGERAVVLTWDAVDACDLHGYMVYRSLSSGSGYVTVALVRRGDRHQMTYLDGNVVPGTEYYYVISSVDWLFNESATSNESSAVPAADLTPPVMNYLTPGGGSVLGLVISISAAARDNTGVDRITLEYSTDGVTFLPLDRITGSSGTLTWDTSGLPSGTCKVRAVATDIYGYQSEPMTRTYTLDHDAPAAPVLAAHPGQVVVVLTWAKNTEGDLAGYRLYRTTDPASGYAVLMAMTTSTFYKDYGVQPGGIYFYRLTALDRVGNESAPSPEVSAVPLPDTTPPYVQSVAPADGSRVRGTVSIVSRAGDNVSIQAFNFYYFDGAVFVLFARDDQVEEVGPGIWRASAGLDTSQFAEGKLSLRVEALDSVGNTSFLDFTYIMDRAPPVAPTGLTVTDPSSGGTLLLSWSASPDSDLAGYYVYRSTGPDGHFDRISGLIVVRSFTDSSLTNGVTYRYFVTAVDTAGNEGGGSETASGTPTAVCDVSVSAISSDPLYPVLGRASRIFVTVSNAGPAPANVTVGIYLGDPSEGVLIGRLSFGIYPGWTVTPALCWTPEAAGQALLFAEVIGCDVEDSNSGNDRLSAPLIVNIAPHALVNEVQPTGVEVPISFSGSSSSDQDGWIVSYRWNFGDGTTSSATNPEHAYADPGTYTVTLTVTDDMNASSSATVTVEVYETRPDLVLEGLSFTPEQPREDDLVLITATVANRGVGATGRGFLVTFYLDGAYLGYTRIDTLLAAGETAVAQFTWIATPGAHRLKVTADDLLDNIEEASEANNSASIDIIPAQVHFPDLVVEQLSYGPVKSAWSSEEMMSVSVLVNNRGDAPAVGFRVSFYIDNELLGSVYVAELPAGESKRVSTWTSPRAGTHLLSAVCDDPGDRVLESNEDNNRASLELPTFTLEYPDIEISGVTWLPGGTTVSAGTTLQLVASVTNASGVDVLHRFFVTFYVDGAFAGRAELLQLARGATAQARAYWNATAGPHTVKAVADEDDEIAEPSAENNSMTIQMPALTLVHPDLAVTDLAYQPVEVLYGDTLTVSATVSNLTVVLAGQFVVSLLVDGEIVASKAVNGLQGYSSTGVSFTWKAKVSTTVSHTLTVVADTFDFVPEEDEENNTFEPALDLMALENLVIDLKELQLFYVSGDTAEIACRIHYASSPDFPLTPDYGVLCHLTIVQEGAGTVVNRRPMSFDPVDSTFRYRFAPGIVGFASYTVTIEAEDPGYTTSVVEQFFFMDELACTVQTDKTLYPRGDQVVISGSFHYSDGSPVVGKIVYITLNRGSFYIVKRTGTDPQGNFTCVYTPAAGTAGHFEVAAAVFFGDEPFAAQTAFDMLGLLMTPGSLILQGLKAGALLYELEVRNVGEMALLGPVFQLIDNDTSDDVTASLDTSSLPTTLQPGATYRVPLIVTSASESSPDVTQFQVRLYTDEGEFEVTNVEVRLEDPVPYLAFSPSNLKIGVRPGQAVVRRVEVLNLGKATLHNLALNASGLLPWMVPVAVPTGNLAPGERKWLEVLFAPPQGTSLGAYMVSLSVSGDEMAATLPITCEVSSANRGALFFIVQSDVGLPVANATITLTGRTPYPVTGDAGVIRTYYTRISVSTDAEGTALFPDVPTDVYGYQVSAAHLESVSGAVAVEPLTDPRIVPVKMVAVPVSWTWTVTPIVIEDTYQVTLDISFVAEVEKPALIGVPPWIIIPYDVTGDIYDQLVIINPSRFEIREVTLEVVGFEGLVLQSTYAGTMAAESSVVIPFRINSGRYPALDPGQSFVSVVGTFTAFDPNIDENVEKGLELRVPLARPRPGGASVWVECGDTKINLPEADGVLDFGAPEDATVRALVRIRLSQEATLEREAFEAVLELTNPTGSSLTGVCLEVRVRDGSGVDVTHLFYPVPPVLSGIAAIDGTADLPAGSKMTSTWTLVPRQGLGGETEAGKRYYVYCMISYRQGGRLVQTRTEEAGITVHPEPELYLFYYLPRKVKGGVPFKLGVLVENRGLGTARNLRITSGYPRIVDNQSGLRITFEMLDCSFGTISGEGMTVQFGDIAPGGTAIGYWLLRCDLPGTFLSFTAELTHSPFMGVEIHPLIRAVDTEIIEKDDMTPTEDPEDYYT
ncbi:MAG: carboxypeptidase regulatory-like domain-containing protein, partial [Actinobacteria bacterium]|nr:carboxypeptidase regulatory-like domain-containing protein [Actinomycetota bacterium]